MADKVAFPVSVGPFTMTPVPMAGALNGFYQQFSDFPKPDPASSENMMAGWDVSRLPGWGQMDCIFAQLSPLHKLTLDDETKAAANIPTAAQFFAWAYPAVLDNSAALEQRVPAAQLAFMKFGGYVYFDNGRRCVGTNGIAPTEVGSPGLTFGRPQPLPDATVEALVQTGRFQEVTLDALTCKGATHFAWIRPEEFGDVIKNPNGSFAYKFQGAQTKYYPVIDRPVFTKDLLAEELDDGESWVVLRCQTPPQQDELTIFEKSSSPEEMVQRYPNAADWMMSPERLQIYRDSTYRTDGSQACLTFDDWKAHADDGDIADPWVFELRT